MTDEPLGPAFDTSTLIRPTQRKFVCCWMEDASTRTLLLPQVWTELTHGAGMTSTFRSADAWRRLAEQPDSPFRWAEWSDDLEEAALDLRGLFTQACFPRRTAEQIPYHSDAIIVSQALALGTDLLVTSDINSMDHYEINLIVEQRLGRNAGFVVTLDDAIQKAYPGGDAGQALLTLALSTIAPAPDQRWPVDVAHRQLGSLRAAMVGATLRQTAARLETRWEQCPDLAETLQHAQAQAAQSRALEVERIRAQWHLAGGEETTAM